MTKLHFITLFFCFQSIAAWGQSLNNMKDKVLFKKKNSDKFLYYDLKNDKVINTIKVDTTSVSENYPYFKTGFSPNDKLFYILIIKTDTNYNHKNWKPNRYYTYYNTYFKASDSGWHIDKSVEISKLNIYSATNGSFLFSLQDTGFYYYDLSIDYYEHHSPQKQIGIKKLPCFIRDIKFFENSDSLIIVNTENTPGFYNEKYSIWDLTKKKKIFDNIKTVDYDLKLSDDKKCYYRFYAYGWNPPHDGRQRDRKYDYDKVDVFSSKNFKPLNKTEQVDYSKKNRTLIYTDELVFDSTNKPLIITEVEEYKEKNICHKYVTIKNLYCDSLYFKSNSFSCDSNYRKYIPKKYANYYFDGIGLINKIYERKTNYTSYSNDSSFTVNYLDSGFVQIVNSSNKNQVSLFKKELISPDFYFIGNNKLIVLEYERLKCIFDILKNSLIVDE